MELKHDQLPCFRHAAAAAGATDGEPISNQITKKLADGNLLDQNLRGKADLCDKKKRKKRRNLPTKTTHVKQSFKPTLD